MFKCVRVFIDMTFYYVYYVYLTAHGYLLFWERQFLKIFSRLKGLKEDSINGYFCNDLKIIIIKLLYFKDQTNKDKPT